MFLVLSTVLGLLMTFSGYGKLSKSPMAVKAAEQLNYTNLMTFIGSVEVVGGVVAVAGNSLHFIPVILHQASVLGLTTLMAGAVMFHLRAKDVKGATIPAMLCFVGIIALSASVK